MQFSFKRTAYLFVTQWVEHKKLYLLGAAALAGIMAVVLIVNLNSQNFDGLKENTQESTFEVGLLFAGAVFTSTILSSFSEKTKTRQALMLPASALEKTIVAVVYSLVVFPLVYVMVVYPLVLAAHYIDINMQGHINLLYTDFVHQAPDYFVLQSMVLACSVIFNRFTFIKVAALICVTYICVIYMASPIANMVIGDAQPKVIPKSAFEITMPQNTVRPIFSPETTEPFTSTQFVTNNAFYTVKLPDGQQRWFGLLFVMLVPFFVVVTWQKLKEKHA